MTDSQTQTREELIELGAKMAEVLDAVGGEFIGDEKHVRLDCTRIDALAAAAAHKIGRDKAAQVAQFVRAGLAQCNGLGAMKDEDSDGYDQFGRIAYATVSLAVELGVQAVSAGVNAGIVSPNGQQTNRQALAMRIVDRMHRRHMQGGEMFTPELMADLVAWGGEAKP